MKEIDKLKEKIKSLYIWKNLFLYSGAFTFLFGFIANIITKNEIEKLEFLVIMFMGVICLVMYMWVDDSQRLSKRILKLEVLKNE